MALMPIQFIYSGDFLFFLYSYELNLDPTIDKVLFYVFSGEKKLSKCFIYDYAHIYRTAYFSQSTL